MLLVSKATADFAIYESFETPSLEMVCSAHDDACDCISDPNTPQTFNSDNIDYFQIGAGLCGNENVLDAYFRDGWYVYIDGAPAPDIVAGCNLGAAIFSCGGDVWQTTMYCASSICENQ